MLLLLEAIRSEIRSGRGGLECLPAEQAGEAVDDITTKGEQRAQRERCGRGVHGRNGSLASHELAENLSPLAALASEELLDAVDTLDDAIADVDDVTDELGVEGTTLGSGGLGSGGLGSGGLALGFSATMVDKYDDGDQRR